MRRIFRRSVGRRRGPGAALSGGPALVFGGRFFLLAGRRREQQRDTGDADTLRAIATACGLDPKPLFAAAETDAIKANYQAGTDRAIAAQVFGAPSYVIGGEIFWGQDRLEFVERALAKRG